MAEMAHDYIVTNTTPFEGLVDAPPAETEVSGDTPADSTVEETPEDSLYPESLEEDEAVRKHSSRLDRRFSKLTGRIRQADQTIAQLRTQVETLLAVRGTEPSATSPTATAAPQETDYATYDAYVQALIESRTTALIEAKLAEREQQTQQEALRATEQAAQQALEQRIRETMARHPDYDEVIETSDFTASPQLFAELRDSEVGPEIAYYLAQHPEEGQRLNQLPPRQLTRAVLQLETQVQARASAPRSSPARPAGRPSVPLTPVGQGGTMRPVSTMDLGSLSFEEFKAARARGAGR
jgi:hypothetical protein